MYRCFLICVALCSLLYTPYTYAQPEIVPAEHPVYEFMHQQRVRGILPEYRHEMRPLSRGQIGILLDSLEARAHTLDSASRQWLTRFHREIYEPEGSIQTIVSSQGIDIPLDPNSNKFFFYYDDDDWRIGIRAIGRFQYRHAELGGETLGGFAFVPEGILEGNYRNVVGFYSGTFNGQQFGGDTRVLAQDPFLAPLYYIGVTDEPQGNFDRSTASLRVANRLFSAEIGHARIITGSSFASPLILTDNPDYFSYIRAGVDGPGVQYVYMHGALGSRPTYFEDEDSGDVAIRGIQRYLAMHRITINPWRWLQLAFTETVVYGGRNVELAYLNPLYPIKPAEHALWDQDNAEFALEAVVRPTDGVEAYGTFYVSDLDYTKFGQGSWNNKWAVQGGIGGAIGPALGWIEYTRIEPFVYTHRFVQDGVYYNSYIHNEYNLGHHLGPNTDQWLVGMRGWLPWNLRGEVQARYVRRGENYVDPETGEFINVGGDVRDGNQPPYTEYTKQFLAGDLFQGLGGQLKLTWEPIQGFNFSLLADYQQWDNDPNRLFVRSEVVIGF